MIKLSNIRIGETSRTQDKTFPNYFSTALVDITKYSFRIFRKKEKDVPVLCEWHSFFSEREIWIRVDTQEKLPHYCSYPLYKAVKDIEMEAGVAASISRYEALKSGKL